MNRKRRHSRCSELEKESSYRDHHHQKASSPKSRKENDRKSADLSIESICDFNIGNKSWADLVFEEEEEERRTEEKKNRKHKDKVRFKDTNEVTNLVYESFKFSTAVSSTPSPHKSHRKIDAKNRDQSDNNDKIKWQDRLRSPAKPSSSNSRVESPLARSPRLASKRTVSTPTRSPKPVVRQLTPKLVTSNAENSRNEKRDDKKRKLNISPEKPYRIKRVLDDDSQDTLTESLRIRNPIVKQSPVKPVFQDEETQSTLTDRPKRFRGPPARFPHPELWVEPKNGYETDPAILARREKDIRYGYASEIYKKYFAAIPKSQRVKEVHPKTPNKFLKVTRRSWDNQIRLWRRLIYIAMNVEPASSDCSFLSTTSSSANVSFCSSENDEISSLNLTDEDFPALISSDERTQATLTGNSSKTNGPTNFASLTMATN